MQLGSAYPADHTLPVGPSVSGLELLRQTLEVINPEAVVTREDVAGQVTLEAVPVVTFSLPLLQPRHSREQVWVTPPSNPPTTAGEETRALSLQPEPRQTLHSFTATENKGWFLSTLQLLSKTKPGKSFSLRLSRRTRLETY